MTWRSPCKPWALLEPQQQHDARLLWGAARLRYKLDPAQRVIYDELRASHERVNASAERIYGLDISRQFGKDFIMSVLAIETALGRMPGSDTRAPLKPRSIRIPYAAPTREEVKELIVPTMETIFQDCPPELQPIEIAKGTFRRSADTLTWPWGARIVLVGVDLYPNRLRGPATFAFFFTEPAFVDGLDDLMKSVLLPQMLTQPDGFGVMGSTPPVTPAHPWTTYWLPRFRTRGMSCSRTIEDCPRFTPAQRAAMVQEMGGRQSSKVRRELYTEHVVESTLVVVPEFAEVKNAIVVDKWPRPKYADAYVAIDPGMADGTGALFGYLDWGRQCLVIEGDFWESYANTDRIATLILAREWQLFGTVPKKPEELTDEAWSAELERIKAAFYPDLPIAAPFESWRSGALKAGAFMRFSDTDLRLIADLSVEHGLQFSPALKDGLHTAVNLLRLRVQGERTNDSWQPRIVFNRRCSHAIAQFEQALWNKNRTAFAHSSGGGHFDCLAAGVYLVRMAAWGRNPNPPADYGLSRHQYFIPPDRAKDKTHKALESVFRPSKARRQHA